MILYILKLPKFYCRLNTQRFKYSEIHMKIILPNDLNAMMLKNQNVYSELMQTIFPTSINKFDGTVYNQVYTKI